MWSREYLKLMLMRLILIDQKSKSILCYYNMLNTVREYSTEAYSQPCQIYKRRLLAINYFCKKGLSCIFYKIQHTHFQLFKLTRWELKLLCKSHFPEVAYKCKFEL